MIPIYEAYPQELRLRLEQRDQQNANNLPSSLGGIVTALIIEEVKLWDVGEITVSFKGGSTDKHRAIAEVASEWSKYANIRFDFGYDSTTQTYREWVPQDQSHIRVGFSYKGYWSLVGTDSLHPAIVSPGDISLNLENFDQWLPTNWQGTVLHEFGHALGFLHEHQHPNMDCGFDWPKVYSVLGDPPNSWDKDTVDHNLKRLPNIGLKYGPHDKASIMHYPFDEWMFKNGSQSPCFTQRNNHLSDGDKNMAQEAYPFEPNAANLIRLNKSKHLHALLEVSKQDDLNKDFFQRNYDFFQQKVNHQTIASPQPNL